MGPEIGTVSSPGKHAAIIQDLYKCMHHLTLIKTLSWALQCVQYCQAINYFLYPGDGQIEIKKQSRCSLVFFLFIRTDWNSSSKWNEPPAEYINKEFTLNIRVHDVAQVLRFEIYYIDFQVMFHVNDAKLNKMLFDCLMLRQKYHFDHMIYTMPWVL